MRIAISSRESDPGSRFEPHFGHARWFLIYDTVEGAWSAVENAPPPGRGAGIAAARHVCGLQAQAVITGRMGPHPREILATAGIEVKRALAGSVEEVLGRYLRGELADLEVAPEDRCRHDHASAAPERSLPGQGSNKNPDEESHTCHS